MSTSIGISQNAVAGPSTPSNTRPRQPRTSAASSGALQTPQSNSTPGASTSTPGSSNGKRVLPARIRRAAGGGQEGVRDLEEMIVDWLERWGAPCDGPPDGLRLHITSLPLSLVHPPTKVSTSVPPPPKITLTPKAGGDTRESSLSRTPGQIASPRATEAVMESKEKIETPTWKLVRAGEDDEEEAREEMSGRGVTSPLKRLRHITADEDGEDTSDAYYISLHRKFEAFERRQRIREREKLVFDRYKMKSRIDTLRNMSSTSWATVVNTVLSRDDPPGISWAKGREKVARSGAGWLKGRLVKEGRELVKRYDQLLPPDSRRSRQDRSSLTPTLTPEPEHEREREPYREREREKEPPRLKEPPRPKPLPQPRIESTPESSLSPPPPVLPARVTALRDPPGPKRPIKPKDKESPVKKEEPEKHQRLQLPSSKSVPIAPAVSEEQRKRRKLDDKPIAIRPKPQVADVQPVVHHHPRPAPVTLRQTTLPFVRRSSGYVPPVTPSGLPGILQAASRREATTRLTTLSQPDVKVQKPVQSSLHLPPFGLAFPPTLEIQSEFSLAGEKDIWMIVAEREAGLTSSSSAAQSSSVGDEGSGELGGAVSREDVLDMRAVEAAVVL